jgi:hypothetical protein
MQSSPALSGRLPHRTLSPPMPMVVYSPEVPSDDVTLPIFARRSLICTSRPMCFVSSQIARSNDPCPCTIARSSMNGRGRNCCTASRTSWTNRSGTHAFILFSERALPPLNESRFIVRFCWRRPIFRCSMTILRLGDRSCRRPRWCAGTPVCLSASKIASWRGRRGYRTRCQASFPCLMRVPCTRNLWASTERRATSRDDRSHSVRHRNRYLELRGDVGRRGCSCRAVSSRHCAGAALDAYGFPRITLPSTYDEP